LKKKGKGEVEGGGPKKEGIPTPDSSLKLIAFVNNRAANNESVVRERRWSRPGGSCEFFLSGREGLEKPPIRQKNKRRGRI